MIDINIVKLKKYASICSVLYVEDDTLIREATASFLGRFFPDVVLAKDGIEGINLYKSRAFDVVITDINMPHMNGIEMIQAIKEINYEQPIIVTSAYNDSENLMKLIELDVDRFVLKPFNNKQFLYVLYKIAEELSYIKERELLQNEVSRVQIRTQHIVNELDIGIVLIKDNKIIMANDAFLKIGEFDTFETLQLEMPEIGILFEEASHSISASTNEEFIELLQSVKKEDSIVKVTRNKKTIEYQVSLTFIEEDESYIVSFTDITALHNAMYTDLHTKLPTRDFIIEKLDLLKNKSSELSLLAITIKHFENLEKIYGKRASLEAEIEFAHILKSIKERKCPDGFIGYFSRNCFLIILPIDYEAKELREELENIRVSTSSIPLELFTNVSMVKIETTKEMNQIEIDLINSFDFM
jgi:CheY-like chemotaxis protein/GGDEF domain-containing protein